MRLLLVAAGVAAAVRQAAAADCQNAIADLGYPAINYALSNLDSTVDSDEFHIQFDSQYCNIGWSGRPDGVKCATATDPVALDGCLNLKTTLKKVDSIAKKCKNDKMESATAQATTEACYVKCQEKMATTATKSGSMAIAFEKSKVCDCYPGVRTYGMTCDSCEGRPAYGAGVEYYIPTEAGHYILPKSCAPASTDDDKDESAASLPLAGATVVAAGVASLYA